MMKLLLAIALFGALAACQTTSPRADAWCLTNSPERPSDSEIAVMSESRTKQLLAHNLLGAKHCGWVK